METVEDIWLNNIGQGVGFEVDKIITDNFLEKIKVSENKLKIGNNLLSKRKNITQGKSESAARESILGNSDLLDT